jgi:predicted transcriptional regulator
MESRLGEHIRGTRERLAITQAELARLADVDQADLSRIERGLIDPRWTTAQRLLDALGCQVTTPTTRSPALSDEARKASRARARRATIGHAPLITVKR